MYTENYELVKWKKAQEQEVFTSLHNYVRDCLIFNQFPLSISYRQRIFMAFPHLTKNTVQGQTASQQLSDQSGK